MSAENKNKKQHLFTRLKHHRFFKTKYWFAIHESWIPRIITAIIAYAFIELLAPKYHEEFVERASFFQDQKKFYDTFSNNFSALREIYWDFETNCSRYKLNKNVNDFLTMQQSHAEKMRLSYMKFVTQAYNIELYFGEDTRQRTVQFIQWYDQQNFQNCTTYMQDT